MSSDFHAFAAELFASLGSIRIRKMFGGAGIYCGEKMFALIAEETIYLKADEALKAELSAEGSRPFVWMPESGPKAGQIVEMGYWRLPEAALDDPELAAAWGAKALAVARASGPAKKKKPKA